MCCLIAVATHTFRVEYCRERVGPLRKCSVFQRQLIVQLLLRCLVGSYDLTDNTDNEQQFFMILGQHISNSTDETKRQNTLQESFLEHLENAAIQS